MLQTLSLPQTPICTFAISQIEKYEKLFAELNLQIKVGFELEFMVKASPEHPGTEVLDIETMERELKQAFPGKIERFYKEWPLGFTSDDKGFEFPGIRKYEVTFVPNTPLEICRLANEVKVFLAKEAEKRHVELDFHAKPFKNEQVQQIVDQIKSQSQLPPDVNESLIVYQSTGNSTQPNISLWSKDKNMFFDEQKRDGTLLFFHAAAGLIASTHDSLLPFVLERMSLLRLSVNDTETAAPGSTKIAVLKGGEKGKGIIRPSPLPDNELEDDYPGMNKQRRSNETFRMEIRHLDPSQDFYVSFAAILSSLYYGITKKRDLSIQDIQQMDFPFETTFEDAIATFQKSTLWKELLGDELYTCILQNAVKACLEESAPKSHSQDLISFPPVEIVFSNEAKALNALKQSPEPSPQVPYSEETKNLKPH